MGREAPRVRLGDVRRPFGSADTVMTVPCPRLPEQPRSMGLAPPCGAAMISEAQLWRTSGDLTAWNGAQQRSWCSSTKGAPVRCHNVTRPLPRWVSSRAVSP